MRGTLPLWRPVPGMWNGTQFYLPDQPVANMQLASEDRGPSLLLVLFCFVIVIGEFSENEYLSVLDLWFAMQTILRLQNVYG